MKYSFLILSTLLPIVGFAQEAEDTDISCYQEVIYAQKTDVEQSTIREISIQMSNPKTLVKGFQFDMYLPEQFEVVISPKEEIVPQLSLARTSAEKTDFFSYSIQTNGALRVLCYSSTLSALSKTTGEICVIPIKAKENTPCGSYALTIKNIIYSDGTRYCLSDDIITSVLTYLPGDVNGDSYIDVADIVRLSSFLNGTPEGSIIIPSADADKNQTINNDDAKKIFSMILQGYSEKNDKSNY